MTGDSGEVDGQLQLQGVLQCVCFCWRGYWMGEIRGDFVGVSPLDYDYSKTPWSQESILRGKLVVIAARFYKSFVLPSPERAAEFQ